MHDRENEDTYLEDEFDLNNFRIQAYELRKQEYLNKKNRKLIRLISLIIMILSFLIAYGAYQILNYYIGILRNEYIKTKTRESITTTLQPAAEEPSSRPLLPDIVELRAEFSNDDIVGFLQIKDTNIEYAVAQASDNEFYLNRDLYGKENSAGSIFMDFENNTEELDKNTVIYGHNMGNGSMFHNLRYYSDRKFYEENPYIYLKTPYEETVWRIFAFYRTGTDFYYIQTDFESTDDFLKLVRQMQEKSIHSTDVSVNADNKILTLSTCTNEEDDSRYVLNAKLISH